MMDPSPAVQRAIQIAQSRAASRGHEFLVAADYFMGLLAEEDGRAAELLRTHGGPWESIRLLDCISPSLDILSTDHLLQQALSLARSTTALPEITSDFFLVAILQLAPGLNAALTQAGVRTNALMASILEPPSPPIPLHEPLRLTDPPNYQVTTRILDVNANRAREALRVLDDYCRFALNDAFLTHEFKTLRHDLVTLLDRFSPTDLLQGRNTIGDVGTSISTATELHRDSPASVAMINLKRLQESLRSLEEYGKIIEPNTAQALEQLRYRTYTLERTLGILLESNELLEEVNLCILLSRSQCTRSLDWTIHEAAGGGAKMFQLREKELDDRSLLQRAREVRRWTRETHTLFIMNDRPDLARLAEADGVHLGQDDLSIRDARRIMGPNAIIGQSTHNQDQVRQAILEGATYIGVGPTFTSTTKQFDSYPGLDFVRWVTAETTIPAFIIGGVNLDTIGQAIEAGACRVAVSAAVAKSDDPRRTTATLIEALRTDN